MPGEPGGQQNIVTRVELAEQLRDRELSGIVLDLSKTLFGA